MGPWLPCRGGRSYFRHDRFQQAHPHPGSVPGSTDFLTNRIHVGRKDALRRLYLPGCLRLIKRIIVPRHISVGGRACIPVGVLIPAADRVRIRELIPVRLPEADSDPDSDHDSAPDPDPDGPHPDLFRSIHVLASIGADITGRTGFVVEWRPTQGLCPADH
jgi:hypothetical protein